MRVFRFSAVTAVVRSRILQNLCADGWSPEQISGRLALEAARPVISHETIYRFVYAQLARRKDYSWRHYLPRAKSKRGRRGRRGGSPASFIQYPVIQYPAPLSGTAAPCPNAPRRRMTANPPATGRRT